MPKFNVILLVSDETEQPSLAAAIRRAGRIRNWIEACGLTAYIESVEWVEEED